MALAASAAINTVPDFRRKILEIAVAIIMRPWTRLRRATHRARGGFRSAMLGAPDRCAQWRRATPGQS